MKKVNIEYFIMGICKPLPVIEDPPGLQDPPLLEDLLRENF